MGVLLMKNTFSIVVMSVFVITAAGCASNKQPGELSNREIRGICHRITDHGADLDRVDKQIKSAEINLARIRANVLRGEKRSPLAKAMAAHGLQNNQLSATGWAEGMLGNEDIEENAKNEVWFVEVRHAKAKHEELEARVAYLESQVRREERRLRESNFSYQQCQDRGWY